MDIRAVLTGDLVGSTAAGTAAVDKAMETLADAAQHIGNWIHADTRFTRFRGDGWQLCLQFPNVAFRASLYLTARLRAANCELVTRISVGLGTIESPGSSNLSDASGNAFVISGQGLDHMPRTDRLAIHGNRKFGPFFSGIYAQAAFQASRWSPEQAEAVALALDNPHSTQEDLANILGITRQALGARLRSAGIDALSDTLHAFESQDYPIEDYT